MKVPKITVIHQIAYFLHHRELSGFVGLRFEFGKNGPTCREISDLIHESIIDGILEESALQIDGAYTKIFRLTKRGEDLLSQLSRPFDSELSKFVRQLTRLPESLLEYTSTVLFLTVEGVNKSDAFLFTVQRKPELTNDQRFALKLLRIFCPDSTKEASYSPLYTSH